MLINNYEKLFSWKTNDKILAFVIKHAHTHTEKFVSGIREWEIYSDEERIASSASTASTTTETTHSKIAADGLKMKEQIFNVAHRRSNQRHNSDANVHTLLNFFFLHISKVCTSFGTIFSLFVRLSSSSFALPHNFSKVSLNCLA